MWKNKIALIVDDNIIDRQVLKQILKQMGFKSIFEAEDGSIANFKIKNIDAVEGRVDVIFLDMRMPKVDGKTLLKDLKKDPLTKNAKIIMVSGVSEKNSIEEVLDVGVDDYIIKPVEADVVKKKLEKIFK